MDDWKDTNNRKELRKEIEEKLGMPLPEPKKTKSVDYEYNDNGNAQRFVDQYKHIVRYVHDQKTWYIWDGLRWRCDEVMAITDLVRKSVNSIYDEIAKAPDDDTKKKIFKHALRSGNHTPMKNMLNEARGYESIRMTSGELDQNPHTLIAKNTLLNLDKLEIIEPAQDEYCTRILGTSAVAGDCPTWRKFMQDVMQGNQEMVDFIQRALGYTLTGSTAEQCLFFMFGTGSNGKSTFINTISKMMGDYFTKIPTSALMSQKSDRSQQEIARMRGARLVVASETDCGLTFSESMIKDITGGDIVTARHLYGKTFSFLPQHKLWIYGNHKPKIKGTDAGIWSRIHLIPFMAQFPRGTKDCDKDMPEKLEKELPAILMWCLEGLAKYRQCGGLNPPLSTREATAQYRKEMDILGAFLEECCTRQAGAWVQSSMAYQKYRDWCAENGEPPQSQRGFSMRLAERGFEKRKVHGVFTWRGLGIVETNQSDRDNAPVSIYEYGGR